MSIYAKVIASTINPNEHTSIITTVEYRAPRFLLAEINTHGVLAKSAQSSRAVPVSKHIEMIEQMPYVPTFGKNKRGMQADELLDKDAQLQATDYWMESVKDAVRWAKALNRLEAHKQDANRVLEPYAYVVGLLTGTEWDNFFNLRISPFAQPAFNELAIAIKEAITNFTPRISPTHLPYADPLSVNIEYREQLTNISAARCARVSYQPFDNSSKNPVERDIELAARLIADKHMSPFEHAAFADNLVQWTRSKLWATPTEHGRYWGWISNRVSVEKQLGIKSRRSSFNPI